MQFFPVHVYALQFVSFRVPRMTTATAFNMAWLYVRLVLVLVFIAIFVILFYIEYKEEHQAASEAHFKCPLSLEPALPKPPVHQSRMVHRGPTRTKTAERRLSKREQYKTAVPCFKHLRCLKP